jgi:hypothetical protein
MNIKNIIFSAFIMSAALGNSVAVAGVPPMNMKLEQVAAAGIMGSVGTTAGAILLAKKGSALGVKKGASLGKAAGLVGVVTGGITGAVVGGVTGVTIGWFGLPVIKAFRNEIKK